MAKNNLTKEQNIRTRVREIDFVTRFESNINALRDVLGISRPIEKAPGSALVAVNASVTLQPGNVGEGEEIPYSLANVAEVNLGDINIDKYAKAVSIESIKKYGYDTAVAKTDAAFMTSLQRVVMNKFYGFLNQGALVDYQADFQMALAMAKGNVLNLWKSMDKDASDVVAFVNVLDFYQYLGAADVTVQTAFGLSYIQGFMGYRAIFLEDSTKIPRGTVIATPSDNIVVYYVDPSASDFARAGLEYTVSDGGLNMIGLHIEGNYTTAVSESFAIMGVMLFAEYLNGIAVEKIGTAPTTTLSIAPATGTVLGKAVADYQNVAIADNAVKGTVSYVSDYTQFSEEADEQRGYFLALKATPAAGATVTAELIGGKASEPVTLDSDNTVVFQLTEGAQSIEFTATASGSTIIKRLDISKLVRA